MQRDGQKESIAYRHKPRASLVQKEGSERERERAREKERKKESERAPLSPHVP